jgi:hypothetical protein
MLTKKTVLVLGAGASQPFQFPVGSELSRELVDALQPGRQQFDELRMAGFAAEQIEQFRMSFYRSGTGSVDAFLEHATGFIDVGKAALALLLIRRENPDEVFRYGSHNWLRILFENLYRHLRGVRKNSSVKRWFESSAFLEIGRSESARRKIRRCVPCRQCHRRFGQCEQSSPLH